jgi:hypothetical protein
MPGLRTALAAVLGVGFGALMLAFPELVIRVQSAGTRPDRHPGPGGTADVGSIWVNLIRLLGAAFVLGGLYFASRFVV